MLYKTIVLGLIESREGVHRQLTSQRAVPTALDQYAVTLRNRHLAWIDQLQRSRSELDEIQTKNVALELALHEFTSHFDLWEDQAESFPLDAAIKSLQLSTPTG